MVAEADRLASEHVQVMTEDDNYVPNHMTNRGHFDLTRAPMAVTE
jgi:histidinol dehydrogenase